ncbi:hypothetical protein [Arthrobacter sp. OV608]|uniref:hypothetical protein n=1 Tax=Arthrobacter sp. OV608 TaxID=1882768 RepID=UPI001B8ADDB2|nr:hypothetical protein [Arthrobacter sp. OV608]
MAGEQRFPKLILLCVSGLVAGIIVTFVLRAIFPEAEILYMAAGAAVTTAITVPPLISYFQKRM